MESTPGVFGVWQDFCAAAKDHIESAKLLGIPMKPKHHWLLEMGVRSRLQGSPGWVSCWSDESINKCLKDVAAAVRFFKDKDLPKIYKNASFMKEKIDEFKPKVPLALSLRKEGM